MFFNIIKVQYVNNFSLKLFFNDGKSGTIDLFSYLSQGEIFQKITNIDVFKNFEIKYGTLTWLDGEIDIAPETLYEMATNEKIDFSVKSKKQAA